MPKLTPFLALPAAFLAIGCSEAKDNRREASRAAADLAQHEVAARRGDADQLPSAENDRDFIRRLIPIHEQTIDLARQEVAVGSDPEVLALAERVISEEQAQISQMQGLLGRGQQDQDRRSGQASGPVQEGNKLVTNPPGAEGR